MSFPKRNSLRQSVSLLRLEPVTPSPQYKSEAVPLEPPRSVLPMKTPTGPMEMSQPTYVVKQPTLPVMTQITFQAMNFSCSLNVASAPPRPTPLRSCSSFMRPSYRSHGRADSDALGVLTVTDRQTVRQMARRRVYAGRKRHPDLYDRVSAPIDGRTSRALL